ncbi:MAG: inositol monophosphatase family protein [Myxococcaceae bacterium]
MTAAEVTELRASVEEAATRAGEILAERFEKVRTIEFKGGIDLVTDADKASEAELISFIGKRYPDHSILAEESGLTTKASGLRWVIDPLDGTTNYAHRVPHFCVSVAVEDSDGVVAGVVLDPLRGELFSAGRGQGATVSGRPLKTSQVESLQRALVCTGFPYDVRERPEAPVGLFNHFIRKVQGVRRMGAAALDLAYVAAGRFDGYFEFGLKAWDIAAGALLVTEAGGVIRQIDGAPLNLALGDVYACAGSLDAAFAEQTQAFIKEIGYSRKA